MQTRYLNNPNTTLKIVFLILLINCLFFFKFYTPPTSKQNIILNGQFALGYKHWEISGKGTNFLQTDDNGTHLKMSLKEKETYISIVQKIDTKLSQKSLFLFKCNVEATRGNPKQPSWKFPALYIAYADYLNEIQYKDLKLIALFKKNTKKTPLTKIIEIPTTARKIFVVAVQESSNSSIKLGDISLQKVISSATLFNGKNTLFMINVIAFLLLLFMLPKSNHKYLFITLTIIIPIAFILPNDFIKNIFRFIFQAPNKNIVINTQKNFSLMNYPYIHSDMLLWNIKALFHLLSFFVYSLFAFKEFEKFNRKTIFISLIFFATICEILQFFVISRIFGLTSLMLNYTGIVVAFGSILIFNKKGSEVNKEKEENNTNILIIYIRSIIFYILFICTIPPTAIIMWVFPLFTPVNSWAYCRLWGRTINFLLKFICNISIEVKGKPEETPEPTLIISNHTGPWETTCLMPFFKQDFSFVLKKQLIGWKYNFFALGLRAVRPIAISREANSGDFALMVEKAQEHFKKKINVLIFPGGTRKALLESLKIPPGGSLLAKKLKCNIQPVFVDSEKWSRGSIIKDYGLLYPGKIRLSFAPLMEKSVLNSQKVKEIQANITDFFQKQL